jgi:hypothetical protein
VSATKVQTDTLPAALVTGAVGPQTSTNATVVVTGAELDVTQYKTVAYTAIAATHDVDWSVFGANAADYSDEVAVLAATKITAGSNASYTANPAPYRYYRVKVIDDVGGTHGTITVNGIAKS